MEGSLVMLVCLRTEDNSIRTTKRKERGKEKRIYGVKEKFKKEIWEGYCCHFIFSYHKKLFYQMIHQNSLNFTRKTA